MTTLCPNGSYAEMNYLFNVTRQRLFIGHGQVLQPVRTITSCVVWPRTHSVKSEEWCRWSIVGFGTVLRFFFFLSSSGQEGFVQYSIRYSKCTILWCLRFDTCLGSGLGFNWFWRKCSDATGRRTSISRLFSLLEYDKKLIPELLQWVKFENAHHFYWRYYDTFVKMRWSSHLTTGVRLPKAFLAVRLTQAQLRHTFSFPRTWDTHASPS